MAQACLNVLLSLDENVITRGNFWISPLTEYAAEHWLDHVRFGNPSKDVERRMEQLFDPRKPHLSACLWIHDPEVPRSMRTERPLPLTLTEPEYAGYAASWGIRTTVISYKQLGWPAAIYSTLYATGTSYHGTSCRGTPCRGTTKQPLQTTYNSCRGTSCMVHSATVPPATVHVTIGTVPPVRVPPATVPPVPIFAKMSGSACTLSGSESTSAGRRVRRMRRQ